MWENIAGGEKILSPPWFQHCGGERHRHPRRSDASAKRSPPCVSRRPTRVFCSVASTPPGMPGTHPQYFGWEDVNGNTPQYYYVLSDIADRYWLPPVRSASSRISFGYKTPPIRFSQAGGQSAHRARPPNLELALTPL